MGVCVCVCVCVCAHASVCGCVYVCPRVQARTYGADVCMYMCAGGGKVVSGIVKGTYRYN